CRIGDANGTRLRNTFQSCRHVHAIAEDVAMVEHDIPDIDPNAELDPLLLGHVGVPLGHSLLNINRTAHRVHYAPELSQQSIAGILDNIPTVLSDLRIDQRAQVVLKLGVRSFFVQPGQTTVTSHIGRKDGCKASLYTLGSQGDLPLNYRDYTPLQRSGVDLLGGFKDVG